MPLPRCTHLAAAPASETGTTVHAVTTISVLLEQVLRALRGWSPAPDEFTLIESVEAAMVDERDGLTVQWTQKTLDQGVRRFGLVVTTDEVASCAAQSGLDRVLADLHLMLVEPHATEADEHARTWFRSLSEFIV